ncbi:hypothetical protein VTH82DRAFT_3248 [Thermothelomyces myriococcoides]
MARLQDNVKVPAVVIEKSIKSAAIAPGATIKKAANNHTSQVAGTRHYYFNPGSYLCICHFCTCGEAVDYPDDVCYWCNKFHI